MKALDSSSVLHRLDSNAMNAHADEIFSFSCVRNEQLRLPEFLRHHRILGVNRFFIIDNGSSDGTTEYLLDQNDVHVFFTEASYAESLCGVHWLNELLKRFGDHHWALTVDADELFIYPHYETINLHELSKHLESTNANGLLTMLLDMYANKAIKDTQYFPGDSLIDTCPFFDSGSYIDSVDYYRNIATRGGPRGRLFQYKNGVKSPFLGKLPFIKWHKDLAYTASTHLINGVTCSEMTGLLLHFKFLSDFIGQVQTEIQRKEHWDNATQYTSYANALQKNPGLTLFYAESEKFQGSQPLIAMGLMHSTKAYQQLVGSLEKT